MTQPIHAVPGGDELPRLLLVSYHFPPAQTAGALRWQRFAPFVAERGWALDVITLHPDSIPNADPSRLKELPAGTRVYGVPSRPLTRQRLEQGLLRLYRAIRRPRSPASPASQPATAAPDTRSSSFSRQEISWIPRGPRDLARAWFVMTEVAKESSWAMDARALAFQLAIQQRYQAVITCGPPHTVHDAGSAFGQRTRTPHVMDLRDPWSLVQRVPEYLAHPLLWARASRHERRAVAHAALVVANTAAHAGALQRIHPRASGRIISVLNGYDDEEMPPPAHGPQFTIAYAGVIYLDRDPRPLFRAAARVVRDLQLTPAQFGIDLMGDVASFGGSSVEAIAQAEGLSGYVRVLPAGPRRRAMELFARSALLVSLPQDSDMAIPSKVFEYLKSPAWVLALAQPESATGMILAGTGADVVPAGDSDAMTRVIRERYEAYARGERPRPLGIDPALSRRHQAAILLDRIHGLRR